MFPKYHDIEHPLLRELVRRGGSTTPQAPDEHGRSIYAALADEFGLTTAEREERTEDGECRVHWEKTVRWARQKLFDRGLLTSSRRGIWEATRDGVELLEADYEASSELQSLVPEEVLEPSLYIEGAKRRITVNAYERNAEARRQCVEHYGATCWICSFDFGAIYGNVAVRYIHVHHLRPLSEIGTEYVVDPVEDLRPVCPNCHAVLHLRNPAYSIEDVCGFIEAQRQS